VSGWALRIRGDAEGFYAHARGKVLEVFTTRDAAEEIRRALANGAEFEVVEVEK
jgi:hypothetical protein